MKRYSLLLYAVLLLLPSLLHAQKEQNIWYFGNGPSIDFNSGEPVVLTGGRLGSQWEGCATVADRSTGELLFYTNGDTIINRNHRMMLNGYGLGGGISSTQSVLIVPMPQDPEGYYVFTTDAYENEGRGGLKYSIVDMRRDGGLGEVTSKGDPLFAPTSEKLVGIRVCDDSTYWVIARGVRSDRNFYAYRVTATGISPPVISSTSGVEDTVGAGYLKASTDGATLVAVYSSTGRVELYDFDVTSGVISDPLMISFGQFRYLYGASFSQDNSKLYVSDTFFGRLYQFDISSRDSAAIAASRVVVGTTGNPRIGAMQLAPDGKIYVAGAGNSRLYVIEYPNESGMNCTFRPSLPFHGDDKGGNGLPNMIDGQLSGQAGPDVTVCSGETTTVRAFGGESYRWSPSAMVTCDTCAVTTITPDSNITLSVSITTAFGCRSVDTVRVTVIAAPDLVGSGDATICRPDSAKLTVTGATQLLWSPSNGLSCIDCPSPSAAPDSTTTYTIIGWNASGCSDTVRMTVTVLDSLKIDAGDDRSICRGDETQLMANGSGTFRWSPPEGLSCTDCPDPVARPASTTLYTVTVIGSAGCSGSDSVRVIVDPTPTADAGEGTTLCRGESIRLRGRGTGSYRWEPPDGLDCIDCAEPVARPQTTTIYRLRVANAAGCFAFDSVTVQVVDRPVVDAGRDTSICAGESVRLQAMGNGSLQWSPSTGLSCTDCAEPLAAPQNTTTYGVTALGEGGCTASDSITVTVVDTGLVDAGPSQTICSGDSLRLMASDGATWQWYPTTGLSCSDCRNPMAGPSTTTLYTLTVRGPEGCRGSDTVTVRVLPKPVVSAGIDVSICPDASTRLHAEGAVSYSWSPPDGLSCVDCADPIAAPSTTTIYHVTGTTAEGCAAVDTVKVIVADERRIQARIDTSYRMVPGATLNIPLVLDEPVDDPVDTLMFRLHYRGSVLRLREIGTIGTLLDGWQQEVVADSIGGITMRFIAKDEPRLRGTGSLLWLRFAAYVGDTIGSDLPFEITFGNNTCLDAVTNAGRIGIDSICGLSYRLIESYGKRYALDKATPNPFNPTATIAFELGLDGETRLVVINAIGEEVDVLVDGYLEAGRYEALWDATDHAAGLYYYRLTSGAWSRTGTMVLRR